jgi:hypothetical protein
MLRLTRLSIFSIALFSFVLIAADAASAQLRLPRPSQKASVMQTIGVTDVTITYHRPGVKGRKIYGDWPADAKAPAGEGTLDNQNTRPPGAPIVPYGRIWRTGANDATQITFSDDVLVGGQPLPAGTYSLHTVPGKDEWTVVFNGTANQWGSFSYDATKDLLRIKTIPQVVADNQEWLAFQIEPAAENAARVNIRWEKLSVPFTVEVKDVTATALARARTAVAAAKPDDWTTPFQAANYAKANKAPEDAARWFDQALKVIDEQIKTKPTFQNYTRRATTLLNAGKMTEALAAAEKAVEVGKAEKADTAALEKRIVDIKAGKME